jgi:3-dehydroquinate dehydratase
MPYKICVSIGAVSVDDCLGIIRSSDMAEIRLDLMMPVNKWSSEPNLLADIKRIFSTSNNLIATCRNTKDIDDEKRFRLLCYAVDCGAKYVDVELDASDEFKERMIKKLGSSESN